jgi:hypothetical protein
LKIANSKHLRCTPIHFVSTTRFTIIKIHSMKNIR